MNNLTDNNMPELLALVKQCLGIISSASAKDNEINMLINSAIEWLEGLGIEIDLTRANIQNAIVMYVKGHFGMIDENVKKQCLESCNLLASFLQVQAIAREE